MNIAVISHQIIVNVNFQFELENVLSIPWNILEEV